jgi:transposase-like protein
MIDALRKEIKRLHHPVEVMLVCVRWYAAYPLSLRHIEEMMAGSRPVRTLTISA